MFEHDEMTARMKQVRDDMLAVLREHDDEAHGGRRCAPNYFSAVAYLAHSAGVHPTEDAIAYLTDMIAEYHNHCPGCAGDEETKR